MSAVSDGARRRMVGVGTAQGAGLREADSAKRRVARGGQRKAPGCERGTAQGANCESGMYLHINIVLTNFRTMCGAKHILNTPFKI
eukprot:152043-Pleurochrysis_carterae.AAC.1